MSIKVNREELSALYALMDVHGIGLQRTRSLLETVGSARAVLSLPHRQLVSVEGITADLANQIAGMKVNREHLERADRVLNKELTIFHFLNENYPAALREIPDAPVLLYAAGRMLEEHARALAVVGTRSSSAYGHRVTRELTKELVRYGFTIVSGLARGIDTQAHKTALEAGGRTIAVLGSGIDTIYPRENTGLAREIAYRGYVCSEYPPGTPPDAGNFPERNRIISGLSLGTIVMEAGDKSGALLTALIALDQNREVFAVPGPIDKRGSVGANRLIKHGAKLVQIVDDILEELAGQIQFTEANKPPQPVIDLSEAEREIYRFLSSDPMHIDELALKSGQPTTTVLTHLLNMELRAVVRQLPGMNFIKGL